MKSILVLAGVLFLVLAEVNAAQTTEAVLELQKPMTCGPHGDIDVLCGANHPEDIEPTPDGRFLIATAFLSEHPTDSMRGGMELFDIQNRTFSKMTIVDQPEQSWGDLACPGPLDDALVSHGESLTQRKDGRWALYVVNHARRESIEMFELQQAGSTWHLIWRGCEIGTHAYNDVAILPDGGFVGSQPLAFIRPGEKITRDTGITGYVARWTPGKGESEMKGTRMKFPNGVIVSPDGRFMYVNEFLAGHVLKYDLKQGKLLRSVNVDFLPDNLTWSGHGTMFSAGMSVGIKDGPSARCPKGSDRPCVLSFGIAEIDPTSMKIRRDYSSEAHDVNIEGVTVALRVQDDLYLGSHLSDRLVRIPLSSLTAKKDESHYRGL